MDAAWRSESWRSWNAWAWPDPAGVQRESGGAAWLRPPSRSAPPPGIFRISGVLKKAASPLSPDLPSHKATPPDRERIGPGVLLLVSPVRCRLTRRPGRLPAPVQKVSAAFCRNGSCKRLLALQLRNQRKAINPPSPGCKNQKCVKKCVIDAENRLDSNESKRFFFMPVVGVEPTRYHYQWILSPHRLPFRHTGTSVDVQQLSLIHI